MSEDLKSQVISGVAWNTIARVGQQIIQFIISIILARLLAPEDFGTVAMLVAFTSFLGLLADAGLGQAIVQKKDLGEKHLYSIFWLSVFMGLVLTILMFLSAPVLAAFYDNPVLVPLVRVWSLNFLIGTASAVPASLMQKRFEFNLLARVEITGYLLSGLVGIFLALTGWGLWALAAQALTNTILLASLRFYLSRFRTRFIFEVSALRDVFQFTIHLFSFNLVNYFSRNADTIIVGRVFGPFDLGNYNRAYGLMTMPIIQVINVISSVMFAVLSSIQDDKTRVKRIYLRAMGMITLIAFPIMVGMWVTAEPLILTLYGEHWSGVINLLRILAPVGILQSLHQPIGWLFVSQGKTDIMFRYGVFMAIIFVSSFVIGTLLGSVEAVAIAYAVANVVVWIPYVSAGGRLVGLTVIDVISAVQKHLISASIMGIVVWISDAWLLRSLPDWQRLLVMVPLGIVSYFVLIMWILPSASAKELEGIVRARLATVKLKSVD